MDGVTVDSDEVEEAIESLERSGTCGSNSGIADTLVERDLR